MLSSKNYKDSILGILDDLIIVNLPICHRIDLEHMSVTMVVQKTSEGPTTPKPPRLFAKYLAFCNLFLILFPFPIFSRDCGKLSPNNKDERG
jgi:hypothetical protein